MRIKKSGSHKREILYMSVAIFFALNLITYFIFLVHGLTQKASIVFGGDIVHGPAGESFNFAKYDEIMKSLYPGSTTVLSGYTAPGATPPPATTPASSTTTTTP